MEYFYGVLNLSFWGYVLTAFILIEITVLSVTLYLHRDAAHRALDLHPAIRHFCRFWLWFTTGITTREWVAIHRKHHARCETPDDPHSPQIEGLKKVLLEGAELYKFEARNQETLEKYGRGCPDDWVERNVYLAGQAYIGIALMVVTWLILFGVPGLIMIAVQLVSQPLLAAGIINGVGHHTGYRNFECADASRNVVPWGVFLGGEELHNNHHAFPSSAKFSIRPWEFDIGWATARVLSWLGLAKIRRVAPHPELEPGRSIDLETARAVIVNRMHVLRNYTRSVTIPVMKREMVRLKERGLNLTWRRRRLVIRNRKLLDDQGRGRVAEVLDSSQAIKTVDEFRQRLQAIWEGAAVSNERLVAQLKEWCQQAEASGERVLQDFARSLRSYTTGPTALV
jgi:stearoyl-CoA desaturase (delta-9 desaturase)